MKQVSIYKYRQYKDKMIEVRYGGTALSDFNQKRAEQLIEFLIDDEESISNTLRDVTYIKTVMQNVTEGKIYIKYHDQEKEEVVKYENNMLDSYECRRRGLKSNYTKIEYTKYCGLQVSFADFEDKSIFDEKPVGMLKYDFASMVDYINELKTAHSVWIDNDIRFIIQAYELFYEEKIDFSNEEIELRIQTMISILSQYGICKNYYKFSESFDFPRCRIISEMISYMSQLGKITNLDQAEKIENYKIEEIQLIGKTVRGKRTNEEVNSLLVILSKIFYQGKYNGSLSEIDELVKYLNNDANGAEDYKMLQKIREEERKRNKR